MLKKIIYCVFIFSLSLSFCVASSNTTDSKPNYQANKNYLNDIIIKPVTTVSIGIISIATAPIGSVKGLIDGIFASTLSPMLFSNGGHPKDDIIVRAFVTPIAAVGFALGAALYMTYKLPVETAKSLSQKD